MAETNPLEIIRQQTNNCNAALEAARTEKECLEETKKAVFEAAKEHAPAYISEEEEKRFLSNIRQTPCAPPTSTQLTPVLKESFKEVVPGIKYKLVISGKKMFWIGAVLITITVWFWASYYKKVHTFDGTAESWANRMYEVKLQMHDKNPGSGYHEIMRDFALGNAEEAKNKVVRAENEISELQGHRKKYEKMLSELLDKDYPTGIQIIEFQEDKQQRYRDGIFGKTSETYDFIYAKIVPLDGDAEYRVAMERLSSIISPNRWDVYITTDSRISSIETYRQNASKVNWIYSKKNVL